MRGNKGMMTLEAAVILPMILVATILIFWTGILLYDRCVVKSVVSSAVLHGGARAESDNAEIAALMRSYMTEQLKERLVMMEAPTISVTVDYGTIRATAEGALTIPALPLYGSAAWDVSAASELRRLRESQIVRTIHRIDRVIENRRQQGNQQNAQ